MRVTNAHIGSTSFIFTVVDGNRTYMTCFDHDRTWLTQLRIGQGPKNVFLMQLRDDPNQCQITTALVEQFVAGSCWEVARKFLVDGGKVYSTDQSVSEFLRFRDFVREGTSHIEKLLKNQIPVRMT